MSTSLTSNKGNGASSAAAAENTPLLGTSTDEPPFLINDGDIVERRGHATNRGNVENGTNGNGHTHHHEEKPLPMAQILLLCYARMVEPIAFFAIFPFINKMIQETGNMEEADVGFYSGFIESMFSFTQMLLMLAWGRASDRIGRKPVLVFSLTGIAIATAVFGLSKSIPQMVVFRCCAGVFAGTIVTVRAMITENSTPKTQARAFSLFAFSGNVGLFLGPLLGGGLSNPADQFPSVFGKIQFFRDFPYVLPTFVTGSIGASAASICGLFVKETLKKKEKGDSAIAEAPMSIMEMVKVPGVAYMLFLYTHVMLLGLAYTAVMPVFWYTQPALGGYGFSPLQISLFLGGIGVSQAIWLLIFFPMLQHKYSTKGVLKACYTAWPIFFVAAPLCNFFLRQGWIGAFWITAPVLQIGGSGVAMAFTAVQLALNDVSPSPTTLGTLNGLALTLTAAIRTVGPAAFTSLFAAGARTQFLGGYLVWVVLIAIALMGTVALRWYPDEAKGEIDDDE